MKFFFGVLALATAAVAWDYQNHGNDWPDEGFEYCRIHSLQGGVDIDQKKKSAYTYRKNKDLPNLVHFYGSSGSASSDVTLTNANNVLRLDDLPSLTIEPNDYIHSSYELSYAHLHWGGSNHKLNGRKYDADITFYFSQVTSANPTALEAAKEDVAGDWLVVPVFIAKGSKDKKALFNVVDALYSVRENGDSAKVYLDLDEVLPKKWHKEFYTYQGALDFPPCEDSATYIVPRHKLSMNHDQLKQFKFLKGTDGEEMHHNYRSEQKLGSRTIINSYSPSSGKSKKSYGGGGSVGSNFFSSMFG